MNIIRGVFSRTLTTRLWACMARKNQAAGLKTAPVTAATKIKDFDYLIGIDLIPSEHLNADMLWIDEVRSCYLADDPQCMRKLRLREQELLSRVPQLNKQKMLSLYSLQRALFLKFRRWEQIVVNVGNAHQFIKRKVIEMNHSTSQCETEILQLYNQYCAALVLSDRDKLHELLTDKRKMHQRGRRSKEERYSNRQMGDIIYQLASEVARTKKMEDAHYRAYYETVLMQAMGLLVLGERTEAIRTLGCVMGDNYSREYKQKAYIILLTSLVYQGQSRPSVPGSILEKMLSFKPLSEDDFGGLCRGGLKTEEAERMVVELVKRIRNKSMEALQIYQLRIYGRLLCLIAENYYIEGRIADYERVIEGLGRLEGDLAIQLLITFVRMGILFDKKQTAKVVQLFKQFKKMEASSTSEGRQFYNPQTVNQDEVKMNIYELANKAYLAQGNGAQAQKVEIEARILQGTLGMYTLKQPELEEQALVGNWRGSVEANVPYYYLQLELQRLFLADWSLDCSLD